MQTVLGEIVIYVDEGEGNVHKPALVQYAYFPKGFAHLRIFESYPEDDTAVDAFYSSECKPGTWHKRKSG